MDLGIVKKAKIVDEWLTLKDTPTGRVHLKLEWLTLQDSTNDLEQVLKNNETILSNIADPPSSAILTVYLDKAEELPMKKGSKEPSPMVQLSVQDVTRESRTSWNTVNPVWEDAFTFFIQDPHKQDLDIQVKDNDRVQSLGSLSLPLSRLLSRPQLSLDQWFQLNHSGVASRIHINAILRVLWIDESAISSSVSVSDLASSRPQHSSTDDSFATEGVLRIELLEGQNLMPKDNLMGGLVKGKSDPYVIINIGGSTFKSRVIKENLNPTWKEMFELVLTDLPGQDLSLEVFDKDLDMKDDFMGRFQIPLSDIITSTRVDEWFTLSDVKHGRVHLALEWLHPETQSEKLQQVSHYQSKSSYMNKAVPAVALLFVYLEAAYDVPLKKSGKEPKVGAELVLGGTTHKTTVCGRTSSPQWNEAFHFLVYDPKKEELIVKLSHCWDFSLGSVVIPIRELLSQPNLLLDQLLNLDGASPHSQILMKAQLKILCPKVTKGFTETVETVLSVPKTSAKDSKPEIELLQKSSEPLVPITLTSSVTASDINGKEKEKRSEKHPENISSIDVRPPHTTADPNFGTESVLRIHLLEAQNLIAKDNLMGGMVKGKSDPYVKINIGNNTFKSQVIKENLNPSWNEMYELVLTPETASVVSVEVFDKDIDKDDFLGRFQISLSEVIRAQYIDQWFTLDDVKHGRLHLVLEWIPTVTELDKLEKSLQLQSICYENKASPSPALLFVLVEKAYALPTVKGGKEPKAGAELVLSGTSWKTKMCDHSTSPHWGESFHFLIHDPKEDILTIKLFSGWNQPLGSLVLPIKELLSQKDLLLDQWHNLDGALAESQILLRAQLKILASKMDKKVEQPTEKHPEKFIENIVEKSVENPTIKPQEKSNDSAEQTTKKLTGKSLDTKSSTGGQSGGKTPISAEQLMSANKELKQETKPTPRLNKLVASTVPVGVSLSEDTQNVPAADISHDTGHEAKDQSKVSSVGEVNEAVKPITVGESASRASNEQHLDKAADKSHEKISAVEKNTEITPMLPQHTFSYPGFGTQGVLRIHLLEAQNLIAMDSLMGGMVKGKSDPYVKITVGTTTYKSHVIKENLNPTWNEMYEMILNPDPNLEVKFELYDKDIDSDDFLGRLKMKLGDIIKSQYNDDWFSLNDVKHGRLHVVLEWLPTVTQPDLLQQVLNMQSSQSSQNKTVPSAALLFVLIERANALPLKKSGKEPKAGAELVLDGTSYKTKVCDRSTSPQWREAFEFLIQDPNKAMLVIKLSSGWDQPLGSLVLPMRELLSQPELMLDRWLSLDGASAESQILLRAELKILNSKAAALRALGAGPVLSNKQMLTTGQIRISLSYQKKLTVTIHGCRGLVTSSKEGLDTYVSLILLPDKSKATKRKTAVKKKDFNPEFNERFEFDVSVEDAKQRVLSVCVKHNSSFISRDKDIIGQMEIDLAQIDFLSGVVEWFDLKDHN